MAARNLAMSLLHDITPAGRGRVAPSTGRAAQEGRELVQAAGSASSSPAEPLSPGHPKQGETSSRKTGPFRYETLWVPSTPSATVPLPKTLRTSLIFTPGRIDHAGSPSWGSPCWWHHAGPQLCCHGTTVPQAELGTRRGLRPCALHHVCISSAPKLENQSKRPVHPQTRTVPM